MASLADMRLLKVGGLLTGFGLGQGAMFLAQTWLVAQNLTAVLGEIGVGLAVLSLAQWTGDLGGTLLLSRHAAVEESTAYVRAAVVVRVCLSIPIVVGLALFTWAFVETPLVRGMIWGGAGSTFFWAFNISGYLDGKGKSALAGPFSNLAWLGASIGLLIAPLASSFAGGMMIGLLYMAGVAATVLGQYILAAKTGIAVSLGIPSRQEARRFAVDGTLLCLADFPAQLYGRCTIFLVIAFLGSEIAGIYVYIRQGIFAAIQVISFIMRVEFPFVARYINSGGTQVQKILKFQLWSLGAAILVTMASIVIPFCLKYIANTSFSLVLDQLPRFAIWIFTCTLTLILGQALIAARSITYYIITVWATIVASLTWMFLTIPTLGLASVVVGEAAMHILQALVFAAKLHGRHRL
jgi:hypothetical protein